MTIDTPWQCECCRTTAIDARDPERLHLCRFCPDRVYRVTAEGAWHVVTDYVGGVFRLARRYLSAADAERYASGLRLIGYHAAGPDWDDTPTDGPGDDDPETGPSALVFAVRWTVRGAA